MKLKHLDLFSGIGGFALAADRVFGEVEHIFCDNEPFAQEVLKKHWPESKIYGDINQLVLDLEGGISIMDLCQDPAHIVKKKNEPPTRTGERSASQKRHGTASMEVPNDTKNTSNESVNTQRDSEQKSSVHTEGNATVVEKASRHSSQSTIEMGAEQRKEKQKSAQDLPSIEVLSKGDSPQNTDFSATTVTTANTDSALAPINYERPFLLTGGFPCQSFSQAGRRRGTADARWLWPQMFRVIQLTKPQFVIAENVRGLITWEQGVAFETVCTDLEREGYAVQPFVLPAVAVGAPHRRDRVWFVAHNASRIDGGHYGESQVRQGEELGKGASGSYATHPRRERRSERASEGVGPASQESERPNDSHGSWDTPWLEVATRLCRVDDGVPRRMDRNPRLKALGNAIVPQVAVEIFKGIKAVESL